MRVESTSRPKNRGGAPLGNKNALANRPWAAALNRSLAEYNAGKIEAGKALRKIADRVVKKALEGDLAAVQEIANRLDGKPSQQLEVTGEAGGPVQTIVNVRFE